MTVWASLIRCRIPVAGGLWLAACGGQVSTVSEHDAKSTDASVADSGDDPSGCACPKGQVWRNHACLSTLDLGCGSPCTTQQQCGQYETCESCGASGSCVTKECKATCVPTELQMGPVPADSLRIEPTGGSVELSTQVTVYGFPWYIGALGYAVRVGTETIQEFGGGSDCAFQFEAPPRPPGRMPVWVSQYGASDEDVLAGILTYGADLEDCIQPGLPCASSMPCCTTTDAPVACVSGRCHAM